MKPFKILSPFLIMLIAGLLPAQTDNVDQIVYSDDSLPIIIKFNKDIKPYHQTEAKNLIKKYLKLSVDHDLISDRLFTDEQIYTL